MITEKALKKFLRSPTIREKLLAGEGGDRERSQLRIAGARIYTGPDISEASDSARKRIVGARLTPEQRANLAQFTPREMRSAPLRQARLARPVGLGSLVAAAQMAPADDLIAMPQAQAPAIAATPQVISTMREGGLAAVAQELASKGRGGDTMLAHITPEEAMLLKSLGGSGTINPETGLPEFFLKGLFKGIGNLVKKVAKVAAPILPFIPIPGIAGLSPLLTRSLLSGAIGGLSGGKGFDFKRGLTSGLMSYGIGSLAQNANMLPGVDPTGATTGATEGLVNASGQITGVPGEIPSPSELAQFQSIPPSAPISRVDVGFANVGAPGTIVQPGMAPITSAAEVSAGTLPGGVDTVPGRMASLVTPGSAAGAGFGKPLGTIGALGTTMAGYSLGEGIKEQEKIEAAQRAIDEEERRRLGDYSALFSRTLGAVPARAGGLMTLAGGGMTYMEAGGTTGPTGVPRDVTGTGDGMSDSVPATIEGVQEARLADGEFVIPADVVADIGNGSSNAGSKKLYDMMDRIRKARHGTTKQPPEIRAERLMPV